ncbi:hypothetical protein DAPPUDRAFT_259713 [Daphnia pulex]|uniref:Uncharacterized protein n=1 Tax=Daphnia pulex TaxID=6669 RepID=E9HHQ2_DAPPU|nr:hypothetical protein DAPPUDRAFT_259713 [Daphnia pulex]|eukprot:EFX68753.1 hypothetical protein DAPPUDRAFT_259713 [Daphnia pulex]
MANIDQLEKVYRQQTDFILDMAKPLLFLLNKKRKRSNNDSKALRSLQDRQFDNQLCGWTIDFGNTGEIEPFTSSIRLSQRQQQLRPLLADCQSLRSFRYHIGPSDNDLWVVPPATPTMTEGWIEQMPRSKRVRKSVNYAESDLSSLTEPNSQVYDTSRRRSRRARDQLPFSPASPSVVEIAPERASSRSSMPPLEPIFPPTLPSAEEESSRASSPYNFCFQHELEASYVGALLTSLTTLERIAAYRAFRTQMDALLNTLSSDDEYSKAV